MDVPDLTRPIIGRKLVERLDDLFNRGRTGWYSRSVPDDYVPLLAPLVSGRLRLRLRTIPAEIIARVARTERIHASSSETADHYFIKRVAVAWMKAEGATDAAEEVRGGLIAGRADAASLQKRWIVECGNTPVRKLVDSITEEGIRFTLFPFQWGFDCARNPKAPARSLRAVDFEWGADLSEEFFQAHMAWMREVHDRLPVPSSFPFTAETP